ncbi:MAG: cytochrome c oxidase assembly protein [Pseudomonadota bacterium]
MSEPRRDKRRNATLAVSLAGLVCAMIGLSFAAVPLYQLFCQVTGYGGTTQVAEAAPETVGERVMKVRFNADVSPDVPWAFQPEQRQVSLKVGEQGLAFYRAENLSDRTVVGTASFNVTPLKAGPYFSKIECFCFTEQRLAPGESVQMPVSYFIDPSIVEDPNLADVMTITLSYTFFEVPDEEVSEARLNQ